MVYLAGYSLGRNRLTLHSLHLYSSQPNPPVAPGDAANSVTSIAPIVNNTGARLHENCQSTLIRQLDIFELPSQQAADNCAYPAAEPVDTLVVAHNDNINMGGERNMERLLKPKAEVPVRAKKPVAKIFPKLYLDRIETIYKNGQYEKYNLQS